MRIVRVIFKTKSTVISRKGLSFVSQSQHKKLSIKCIYNIAEDCVNTHICIRQVLTQSSILPKSISNITIYYILKTEILLRNVTMRKTSLFYLVVFENHLLQPTLYLVVSMSRSVSLFLNKLNQCQHFRHKMDFSFSLNPFCQLHHTLLLKSEYKQPTYCNVFIWHLLYKTAFSEKFYVLLLTRKVSFIFILLLNTILQCCTTREKNFHHIYLLAISLYL